MKEMDVKVLRNAELWLKGNFDAETKLQVQHLIDNDPKELTESFYQNLEFGTGGLRGVMGVGTNRMNIYTVGMATQGLSNYLKQNFKGEKIKVAIAYDCRNNSRKFAERVADIFASNGFHVCLFDALRPTPELSFAIRHFGCKSGVVITASHNPKEYNGYKAYWDDGSQVTAPHDVNIIKEVEKITTVEQILTGKNSENIEMLDKSFDKIYLASVKTLSLSAEAIKEQSDKTKIVYTPIHGAGVDLVPACLRNFGFKNIIMEPAQSIVDGNFPTVEFPNPEEKATMQRALDLGEREGADIILGTDPDADRIAIGLPNDKGEYILLNGNQTCVLLTYYLCRRWKEKGMIDGKQYVVKTIVTSGMMDEVARAFDVKIYDSLTGFKNIAEIIRNEEKVGMKYIGGGEESFGYLPGDLVRDKDGIASCALAAEIMAWAKSNGMTIYELIKQLYVDYGFYKEELVSLVRRGIEGKTEIKQMMSHYRTAPPTTLGGSKVIKVKDYLSGETLNIESGKKEPIKNIGKSNVLQFITEDGSIISARPSGTEPKIKFYFSVKAELSDVSQFSKVDKELTAKIEGMKKELSL